MTVKKDGSERGERPETEVVHLGRKPFEQHGFVNTPVYRGSTVLYPTLDALRAYSQPYTYGRRATPTTRALEEAITHLEGGAATILTSSRDCQPGKCPFSATLPKPINAPRSTRRLSSIRISAR